MNLKLKALMTEEQVLDLLEELMYDQKLIIRKETLETLRAGFDSLKGDIDTNARWGTPAGNTGSARERSPSADPLSFWLGGYQGKAQ